MAERINIVGGGGLGEKSALWWWEPCKIRFYGGGMWIILLLWARRKCEGNDCKVGALLEEVEVWRVMRESTTGYCMQALGGLVKHRGGVGWLFHTMRLW